jgi:hypothetical protein
MWKVLRGINDMNTLMTTMSAQSPSFKSCFYEAAFPRAMQLFHKLDHNEIIDQNTLLVLLWMANDLLKSDVPPEIIIRDMQEYVSNFGNMSADDTVDANVKAAADTDADIATQPQLSTNNSTESATQLQGSISNNSNEVHQPQLSTNNSTESATQLQGSISNNSNEVHHATEVVPLSPLPSNLVAEQQEGTTYDGTRVATPSSLPSKLVLDSELASHTSILSIDITKDAEIEGSVSTNSDVPIAVFFRQKWIR